jgi:hypothetical protein
MNCLTEKQFCHTRKHDTCAIMGCGYSINDITPEQWNFIKNECDSITFNWYCFKETPLIPTYYCINAQGIRSKESNTPYDYKNFLKKLKCEYKVILTNHFKKCNKICFHYDKNLDLVDGQGIVVHQYDTHIETINQSIFKGAYNGPSSLDFVCHVATYLGYSRIIFFGVDLYDQGYFWDEGKSWDFMAYDLNMNRGDHLRDHLHASAPASVQMMKDLVRLRPNIKWLVHNPKSLFTQVIPVWKL